jgi:hypothetical protein
MSSNRHTRAKEKARIQDLVAANMAAISNARAPATITQSSSAAQPTTTAPPLTANAPGPSTATQPSTTTQSSPSNKLKTSNPPSKPKTSSKSAGKKPLVYNPDIDSEIEECITVLPPKTTPSKTFSGPIDDESRAHAQNNTEPKKPTLKLKFKKITETTSTPETQAPVDIARLALQDRPDATPDVPLQQPVGQRRVHPDYPNLPPEVPVDEEGIRKCNPFLPWF